MGVNTLCRALIPGIYPITPWDQAADDEWEDVFAVNVRGSYWVARAAFPEMKRQGWRRDREGLVACVLQPFSVADGVAIWCVVRRTDTSDRVW